jgi:hypothetical protein
MREWGRRTPRGEFSCGSSPPAQGGLALLRFARMTFRVGVLVQGVQRRFPCGPNTRTGGESAVSAQSCRCPCRRLDVPSVDAFGRVNQFGSPGRESQRVREPRNAKSVRVRVGPPNIATRTRAKWLTARTDNCALVPPDAELLALRARPRLASVTPSRARHWKMAPRRRRYCEKTLFRRAVGFGTKGAPRPRDILGITVGWGGTELDSSTHDSGVRSELEQWPVGPRCATPVRCYAAVRWDTTMSRDS